FGTLVPLVGLWCALAPQATRASTPLEVQRVVTPEAYARLSAAERRAAVPLDASMKRTLEAKEKRWRSFPHDITAPGFNRSPNAALRQGAPRRMRSVASPEA